MKHIFLAFFFAIPFVCYGQIENGNFETWDSIYVNVYSDILYHSYAIPDPLGGIADPWKSTFGYGVSRTTDSHEGQYAMIIHNWYAYAYEWLEYNSTLEDRPKYLNGYYKYNVASANSLPHGYANVSLTWWNGVISDTIAKGAFVFDSISSYTAFSIPLNYISKFVPDSIHISFRNGDRPCDTSLVCNFLYIDQLSLSQFSTAAHDLQHSLQLISVFPNPVIDQLYIQSRNDLPLYLIIFNSLGIPVKEKWLNSTFEKIDFSMFPQDIYFYIATTPSGKTESGKIISVRP